MIRPTRRFSGCALGSVLEVLSARDREALLFQLGLPVGDPQRLSYRQVAEALLGSGFRVHYKTIEQHRKGLCRCEPCG